MPHLRREKFNKRFGAYSSKYGIPSLYKGKSERMQILVLEITGSMYVSEELPTYPSPNLTFCPKREVSVNVRFVEG